VTYRVSNHRRRSSCSRARTAITRASGTAGRFGRWRQATRIAVAIGGHRSGAAVATAHRTNARAARLAAAMSGRRMSVRLRSGRTGSRSGGRGTGRGSSTGRGCGTGRGGSTGRAGTGRGGTGRIWFCATGVAVAVGGDGPAAVGLGACGHERILVANSAIAFSAAAMSVGAV
jgi:hypothetical protein